MTLEENINDEEYTCGMSGITLFEILLYSDIRVKLESGDQISALQTFEENKEKIEGYTRGSTFYGEDPETLVKYFDDHATSCSDCKEHIEEYVKINHILRDHRYKIKHTNSTEKYLKLKRN